LGTVEFERYTRLLWSVITVKSVSSRHGGKFLPHKTKAKSSPKLLAQTACVTRNGKILSPLELASILQLWSWWTQTKFLDPAGVMYHLILDDFEG